MEKNNRTDVYSIPALRDRMILLMSTFGILRGESLFMAELSDLCMINSEISKALDILVLRIAFGKTNKGNNLYGRFMRHRQAEKCPVGALGIYLFARFHRLNEKLDFSRNSNWFNVKLCVGKERMTRMSDNEYGKNMKKVQSQINIRR